jgi:hypothetical protein
VSPRQEDARRNLERVAYREQATNGRNDPRVLDRTDQAGTDPSPVSEVPQAPSPIGTGCFHGLTNGRDLLVALFRH